MRLFFYDFVQVDKCEAVFSFSFSSKEKYYLLLHRQIETEIGSAGEQPTRDKFD